MTAIVGYIDRKNGITYLGGDSLGSNGYSGAINKQHKVFHCQDTKDIIMGYTSSFRMGQLLMYGEKLFDELTIHKNDIDYKYLVTNFIPNIQNLFSKGGYEVNKSGEKSAGEFLLGYKDRLFKIQSDYSVLENVCNYDACGSGEYFALGALKAIEDLDLSPIERIYTALRSASEFVTSVAPPFYIINTANDDVIEFKD